MEIDVAPKKRQIITQERLDKLNFEIEKFKKGPGPLMPTLHAAQHIFGCIPIPVQKIISKKFNESISKINGVITFYSQFSTEPKGDHVVGVCMGTACYVRGAKTIVDKVGNELSIGVNETTNDGRYSLVATRCIGACGLAPVMNIGKEVHGNLSVVEAEKILKEHIIKGE
jgi:NADH:ubiquinone oxidoreductase subunit E